MPKKKKDNEEIFIKVKKSSKKSFWDGVDFEDEKTSSDKASIDKKFIKDKPVEKMTEKPKEAKPVQPIKKKKGKKKYVLFSILFIILAGLIFVFFFVRPTWSKKYEQKADSQVQNKETTYALQNYQKASVLTPRNSGLYSKIANIYIQKSLGNQAKVYAESAIKIDPENKDANLILGQVYFSDQNYEQALDKFKKVLDNDSDNANAYAGITEILIDQNNINEAEDWSQKSFLLYPDNPKIIFNQSLIWFLSGEYSKAEEGFDKLSSDNQNSESVRKSNLALDIISKVSNLPNSPYKEVLLGNFYNQIGLPTLAIIHFNKALVSFPSYRDAYLGLGQSYLSENNYQEAQSQLEKARKQDPVNGFTFYLMGENYQQQKMPDKASENFEKAIERGYDNETVRKKLAEAYLEKQDFDKALVEYQKAVSFNQNDLENYEKIVWLLGQKLNRPQEALTEAQKAKSIKQENALTYNILAEAYLANNDLGNAQDAINKAIAIDNSFALNYYNLALILQKQGKSEEAKANFIKAADLDNQGNIFNQAYGQLKSL